MSIVDPSTTLLDANTRIAELQGSVLQLSQVVQQMSNSIAMLSRDIQQIILVTDGNSTETKCVEPWYEPCVEDANICVHRNIPSDLKTEVCTQFSGTNYEKNSVVRLPEKTHVRLGDSRFTVAATNFPVAHVAGDATVIRGADPRYP